MSEIATSKHVGGLLQAKTRQAPSRSHLIHSAQTHVFWKVSMGFSTLGDPCWRGFKGEPKETTFLEGRNTHIGCGSKTGTQNGTLARENMDQNLRNPTCLIWSHAYLKLCPTEIPMAKHPFCDGWVILMTMTYPSICLRPPEKNRKANPTYELQQLNYISLATQETLPPTTRFLPQPWSNLQLFTMIPQDELRTDPQVKELYGCGSKPMVPF